MKTRTKALLLALSAVLLVVSTVFATMAYLTSQTGVVTNTFSVGNVHITLDEANVDIYGAATSGRGTGNQYKLIPGHTYLKDPTIYVTAQSEACFVFVKVENGIKAVVADTTETPGIETQIKNLGWTELPGVPNVYYQNIDLATATTGTTLKVFDNFTLIDDAVLTDANGNPMYTANTPVNITGYAIQSDGFNGDAVAAWTAGNFH